MKNSSLKCCFAFLLVFMADVKLIFAYKLGGSLKFLALTISSLKLSLICRFTLKRVRDMIITYSQIYRTDKYSQYSSNIWSVWLSDWVFIYELVGFRFESRCYHSWKYLWIKFVWVVIRRHSHQLSSWKIEMEYRTHRFWAIFEPQYLWNVSSKWANF